jgi:hypothetical protein
LIVIMVIWGVSNLLSLANRPWSIAVRQYLYNELTLKNIQISPPLSFS